MVDKTKPTYAELSNTQQEAIDWAVRVQAGDSGIRLTPDIKHTMQDTIARGKGNVLERVLESYLAEKNSPAIAL